MRLILNYGRPHNLSPDRGDGRARGGIVTALLDLAEALASRNHEVHVFAPLHDAAQIGGVAFHHRSEFAAFTDATPPDVLICIPELLPLLMPVTARARVVWSGNAHSGGDCALAARWDWAPQIGDRGRRARLYPIRLLHPYVDRLAMKSRWQANYVGNAQGIPAEKFAVLYNGVRLSLFEGPAPERHDDRLIYTSQARRGLDVLLELLGDIRAAVPGTELHVFGYEYRGDASGAAAPLEQPGVVWRGRVGKAELAHELREAAVLTYPSTFKETFCTSVAEGQAAGLPVVASGLAALSERVADGVDGFVVPGRAGEPGFRAAFVEAVVRLLTDGDLRRRLGAAAAAKAFVDYDWNRIVAQWDELLTGLSAQPPHRPAVDPSLDLLDPSLLHIEEPGAATEVPPELAERWLRDEWASYGFNPEAVPGLP